MAWAGLIRVWDYRRSTYRKLVLRVEDTQEPGCLVRVYEDDEMIDEELAETPQLALHKAVQMARRHLDDPGVTEDTLDWVQV